MRFLGVGGCFKISTVIVISRAGAVSRFLVELEEEKKGKK